MIDEPNPENGINPEDVQFVDNSDLDMIADSLGEQLPIDDEAVAFFGNIDKKEITVIESELDQIKRNQINTEKLPYYYQSKCKCCKIALDDPHIHELFVQEGFSPMPVVRYIAEVHPDMPCDWDQVKNHMIKHFLPKYNELEGRRKEHLQAMRRWTKEYGSISPIEKLKDLQAIVRLKIDELTLASSIDNPRENRENARVIASLVAMEERLIKSEYDVAGINQTPEQIQARSKAAAKAYFDQILEMLDPEDRKRILHKAQQSKKKLRDR